MNNFEMKYYTMKKIENVYFLKFSITLPLAKIETASSRLVSNR